MQGTVEKYILSYKLNQLFIHLTHVQKNLMKLKLCFMTIKKNDCKWHDDEVFILELSVCVMFMVRVQTGRRMR